MSRSFPDGSPSASSEHFVQSPLSSHSSSRSYARRATAVYSPEDHFARGNPIDGIHHRSYDEPRRVNRMDGFQSAPRGLDGDGVDGDGEHGSDGADGGEDGVVEEHDLDGADGVGGAGGEGGIDGHGDGHADGHAGGSSTRRRRQAGGEDGLTVRRREANRLAAQRFRSRKKGYQDSLEDRIKVLEQEKEVLIRQLDESMQNGSRSSSLLQARSSNLRHAPGEMGLDGTGWCIDARLTPRSSIRTGPPSRRSSSPDRRDSMVDVDVRVASLESANRRLQEHIRNVCDENDQLREELRRWRVWSREPSREMSRRSDLFDSDQYFGHPLVSHPPAESGHSAVGYSAMSSPFPPSTGQLPSLSRADRKESFASSSSSSELKDGNMRLPGLRLPPIRGTLSPNTTTLPSPSFSTSLRGLDGISGDRGQSYDGSR